VSLRNAVIKCHIYAGLLTFSQLVIYGAAGLIATAHAGARPKEVRAVRSVSFVVPPSKTDKEVADTVFAALRLPLTRPMPVWAIKRTPENDLLLDFYNINGIWRVTVLEREQQLRIEEIHNNLLLFVEDVHAATTGDREAPRLVRAWAIYNEVAMWCLLTFAASGVYLWLSAGEHSVWAWASLAAGAAAFAALWGSFR
jgi:hypothetical protein